jgi:site-specific DNA recombinase
MAAHSTTTRGEKRFVLFERLEIMMLQKLPSEGAASPEVMMQAETAWLAAAENGGLLSQGFDLRASLADRIAWMRLHGYSIGVACARYSHTLSRSTVDQVVEIMIFTARKKVYVPPEFVCVDEAVTGKKSRRAGLDRAKWLLASGMATVFAVYKLSRLLRTCYKSVGFIQEDVVDQGFRAISVTQNVDTDDKDNWRKLTYLYGLMDESLLTSIGDHVRSSLKTLASNGYSIGAMTAGYDRVEVEGPQTKSKGLRTKPVVNERFREMLNRNVQMHLGGMSIAEGRRRWIADDGARVFRKEYKNPISVSAYRAMLSNPRYTGLWAFGRKKNEWNSKRETITQVEQPEDDVVIRQIEELRVLTDETFARLQVWLGRNKTGPRGLKKPKGPKKLWDYTTRFFTCGCPDCYKFERPFYQTHTKNPVMTCAAGSLCPHHLTVRRDVAVGQVCEKLCELLADDRPLVEAIVAAAGAITSDVESIRAAIAEKERKLKTYVAKINGLLDMVGEGSAEDKLETKAKLAEVRGERRQLEAESATLRNQLAGREPLDPERVRAKLASLRALLEEAAEGQLGEEATYRAVQVFEALTGGKIEVMTYGRAGRKRPLVRGTFTPLLLESFLKEAGYPDLASHAAPPAPVTVWLRPPPQCDRVAERVYQLIDIEQVARDQAIKTLRSEGFELAEDGIYRALNRYYCEAGILRPEHRYNNGRRRRTDGVSIAKKHADEVHRLMEPNDKFLHEIAAELGIDRHDVTNAKNYWYKSRGLPVPDGRERRKQVTLNRAAAV